MTLNSDSCDNNYYYIITTINCNSINGLMECSKIETSDPAGIGWDGSSSFFTHTHCNFDLPDPFLTTAFKTINK